MKKVIFCVLMLFSISTMASQVKLTCGWTTRDMRENGNQYSVMLDSGKADSISFTTTYPPIIKMNVAIIQQPF